MHQLGRDRTDLSFSLKAAARLLRRYLIKRLNTSDIIESLY